jgi:hypothetical protein
VSGLTIGRAGEIDPELLDGREKRLAFLPITPEAILGFFSTMRQGGASVYGLPEDAEVISAGGTNTPTGPVFMLLLWSLYFHPLGDDSEIPEIEVIIQPRVRR